jgi:DnaJ family protein A protein 2
MDPYAEMGLKKGASDDEIRRAYKKEALKRHPDRGGDKESFQRLQKANEVLSDPEKKVFYDQTGQMPGDDAAAGAGPGGIDISEILGGIFGSARGMGGMPFFAGMPGGGGGGPAPKGPNKVQEIGITLADMYHGKVIKTTMKRDVLCGSCDGKGGKRMETCAACKGRGMRMRSHQMGPMVQMIHEPCEACGQTGQRAADQCGDCKGKRVMEREATVDIRIEPGMQEGDRIVLQGLCSESPMYREPGDLVLVVRTAAGGEEWARRGADLGCEVTLTLAEALLGFERTFEGHPSGKPLRVAWKGGPVRDREMIRVEGQGMPVRGSEGSFGALVVGCRVAQETLTEEQCCLLKQVWPDWVAPVDGADVLHATRSL